MNNKKLLGTILLFITAFIWGVAFVFQRTGLDHVGPITFMACRNVLAVLSIALVIVVRDKSIKSLFEFDAQTLKGGLFCGLFMTAANNLQQMGLVTTSAGKSGFITALYMILVPINGFIFLKKKQSLRVWIAVIIGMFGLYLLCVNGGFDSVSKGDLLTLGCAVLFSGHILSADMFAKKADPVKMSLLQFTMATIVCMILMFIFEEPVWANIMSAKFDIIYLGVLSAGAGYTLQMIGQKYVDPAPASLIMCLESVFAVLSGWLLLHESMSLREIAGCVIMFIAILLIQLQPEQKMEA